ncbi:protein SAR DEFICIENT 1 [Alnus glutinosa]|uniref:protein SAR DEFICIENT 1 n=1 Tax=Alnus glutinosa TaxID=3517 RepID=UPI002D779ECA|nr:protein SAR DEFICIENT 1 [Alnus glutinosa]
MAAKRFFNDSKSDQDQPPEKRMKPRPSFASVIGEVVMVNSLHNLFSSLEPLLRRVVKEEVETTLRRHSHTITRSPSLRIQALEPSSLRLCFSKKLSLPIFTGSKITDMDSNPLQVHLVDSDHPMVPIVLQHSIKIELVVLDGDFPGDSETWTGEEFNNKIVKERAGKRPLLTGGDLTVTLREGFAQIGDIEFTDNSSWIRGRKFRLGAKVVPGSYQDTARICEAMTEAFVVKDHRGELYKKHHPPQLEDEVWRLEKIGKDGAFHRKLTTAGIKTVQDFLKLSVVDPSKLKNTLGIGMSEKIWEATIKHAKTCTLGTKLYVLRKHNFALTLNPICQVVRAEIDGQIYVSRDLNSIDRRDMEKLVWEAYNTWSSLQEVDGALNETALITQVETMQQYSINPQLEMVRSFPQNGYITDVEFGLSNCNGHVGYSGWVIGTPNIENTINYCISDASSDGN